MLIVVYVRCTSGRSRGGVAIWNRSQVRVLAVQSLTRFTSKIREIRGIFSTVTGGGDKREAFVTPLSLLPCGECK